MQLSASACRVPGDRGVPGAYRPTPQACPAFGRRPAYPVPGGAGTGHARRRRRATCTGPMRSRNALSRCMALSRFRLGETRTQRPPRKDCMRPCGLSSPRRDGVRSNAAVGGAPRPSSRPRGASPRPTRSPPRPPAWTPSMPAGDRWRCRHRVAHGRHAPAAVLVGDRHAHHWVLRVAGRFRARRREPSFLDLGEPAVETNPSVVQVEGRGPRSASDAVSRHGPRRGSARRGRHRERPGCR